MIADILVGDYNNDGLDDLFCSSDNKTCVAPSEIRRKVITFVLIQFKLFASIDLPRKVRIISLMHVCYSSRGGLRPDRLGFRNKMEWNKILCR